MPPRTKHDWNLVSIQYMTSDIVEFATFLKVMGYPPGLAQRPQARRIAQEKQRVRAAMEEQLRQAVLAEPLLAREKRKFDVLKELEDTGRALRQVVMNRLLPDLALTSRQPNESPQEWMQRLRSAHVQDNALTPGAIAALSIAQKNADELIRKAAGLENFDWENAASNQKAIEKAGKMEFEIVQTSGGRPIAELPWAPEEKKQA